MPYSHSIVARSGYQSCSVRGKIHTSYVGGVSIQQIRLLPSVSFRYYDLVWPTVYGDRSTVIGEVDRLVRMKLSEVQHQVLGPKLAVSLLSW